MKISDAIEWGRRELAFCSSPRLEAEWLVAHFAGLNVPDLLPQSQREVDAEALRSAFDRRKRGEPLAYVLGEKGFYKSVFGVRPGVLIPRPETEHLVEVALRLFATQPPNLFCDIGCGSGCVGLSLLQEWRDTRMLAVDSQTAPIETTRENALKMGLLDRCETHLGPVETFDWRDRFDLIVSNPPYIGVNDSRVEAAVKKFEPAAALFADENGLAAIYGWSAWSLHALKDGGWWIFETGAGQDALAIAKLRSLGYIDIGTASDFSGHVRIVYARKAKL